jgi:hypothetical protein
MISVFENLTLQIIQLKSPQMRAFQDALRQINYSAVLLVFLAAAFLGAASFFGAASFLGATFFGASAFTGLAFFPVETTADFLFLRARLTPYEPMLILPFLDFLSPFPIVMFIN